jgi:hypothetical protein
MSSSVAAEELGTKRVGRRPSRFRLRWTYRFEMRYLLEVSGFEVAAEYSDFRGSPPQYAAEQVWVARRLP